MVEAEIASRDASNARGRLKSAAFPVRKTLDEFDVDAWCVPRATFDYLASLEWIGAKENLCLVGPAGTGKSHLLVALGHHAIEVGRRVRCFTATQLVETLYRGLADDSVGRVIEQILKADLILIDEIGFAPMDNNGAQLFFRIVAAAYERRSLGIGSHSPSGEPDGSCPSTPQPSACSIDSSTTGVVVATSGESFRLKEARQRGGAVDQMLELNITARGADIRWPKPRTGNWPRTSVATRKSALLAMRSPHWWPQEVRVVATGCPHPSLKHPLEGPFGRSRWRCKPTAAPTEGTPP